MKRLIQNIFILGLASVSLFSCTEDIDFDLNESEEQILVVEGYITNQEKVHTVDLSLSGKFYGADVLPKATGATVSISDGTIDIPLTENEPGVYQTAPDVKGSFGKTYTLSIDYEGQKYESISVLDSVPPIDTIQMVPNFFFVSKDTNYILLLTTTEIPGKGNHYLWKTYINGVTNGDTLGNFQIQDDELTDGQAWELTPLEVGIEADFGDTILLEQISISKESYDILISANLETVWRGGIFDAPPSNVPSNISNGAIGLFDARGVAEKVTYITE